jgi:hypothetical protein
VLGACIDDSCAANAGVACHYQYDRCGNARCQLDSDPPLPDPGSCMPPDPVIREDTCRCNSFGGCVDLRMTGGMGHGRPVPF